MNRIWLGAAIIAVAHPISLAQEAPAARHHARPRLIADTGSIVPGSTFNLGVTFEIDPGWHLYWNGRNDSGFPVSIDLALPEGFTAEPPQWPAPRRHLMPGDLLDHIYEDRVTLLIAVHAPEVAPAGGAAEFSARLSWMECSTKCLLAGGDVALKVAVGAGGAAMPAADAALFEEARNRIPVALPPHPDGVSLSWSDGVLEVASPGAEYLGFYPAENGPAVADVASDGESRTGRLALRFEWARDASPSAPERARGVLEVRRPGKPTAYYSVDLAPGEAPGTSQPSPDPAGIR